MPASWDWVLGDPVGAALAEMATATGRLVTYRRSSFVEATCAISHEDDAASALFTCLAKTGVPTLRCYRQGANDSSGVVRFNGYLVNVSDSADETSMATLTFRSPFSRLLGDGSSAGRYTGASVVFAATDAGQMGKALIDTTNLDSFTGLATTGALGSIAVTVNRDRTYQYANIGQAITDLTAVLNGFDFVEMFADGLGTTLAQFTVVPSQGGDKPNARFEYGPGTMANVSQFQRTIDAPINTAVVIGGNGLTSTQSDAASVQKYGRYYYQEQQQSITEQGTLDARAQGLLRPDPVKVVQFTPEYRLDNCPAPFDDFGVGDTVHVYANRGALVENVAARVNTLAIAIDDNGFETAAMPDPESADNEALTRSTVTLEATGAATS